MGWPTSDRAYGVPEDKQAQYVARMALATFALSIATPQLLKFKPLEDFTGGVQGISILKPDPPEWLPINADQWLYYFVLAVLVVLFACAASLIHSRSGRAIMAIRDHPIAARAMGINTALYKSLTFGVSALYTGIAGALGAIAVQFVAPDSFTFLLSVSLLVGLVVGGVGSAGADASAYYAAFRLPDTLFSLIAGGALSSAMKALMCWCSSPKAMGLWT